MFHQALTGTALAVLLAAFSHAQTTFGTITGMVTDSSGAAVPMVKVTARQIETNLETTGYSNESGVFTLPQLREGTYEVRASAQGFRPWLAKSVLLAAREIRRLDIMLEVGTVETAIEVTDTAALIETETARIGDSKTGDRLNHLPVPSRDIRAFLSMSPNVGGSRNSDSFRMAGSFQQQNEFTVDGITVNNGYSAAPIVPLVQYIESFQELRLDMANNTAEFGAIGQFTMTTKAGTNRLRGSAFDYYVTPAFRSRNPFATERPTGISHQPGFSIGGPLRLPRVYDGRNRSFFFTSLETSKGSAGTQLMNATVAPEPWRAGDFGSLTIRDPLSGNTPFPGNRIPQGRLNATSLKIQDRFFPRPNFGDPNTYAVNNSRNVLVYPFQPNTLVTARLDHRISDKSFFYVRGTYNRATFDYFDGALPTIGRRWNRRDTRGLNFSHTQFLTSALVNEFRYGLAFNNNGRNGPQMGKEVVSYLGLLGLADDLPDVNGIFNVSFQNLQMTGISQTQYRKPGFLNWVQQFQNHLSWFRGKHSLKAGALLTRVRFEDGQAAANLFGSATFSNRFTGQTYADFLLGIPTSTSRGFPFFVQRRLRWAYDFFVQDEWKIRSDLTISAGLRYEVHPHFSEANGRQAIFDAASSRIGVSDGGLQRVSPLMPLNYADVVEASSLGYPGSTLIRTDRNNFAPRLGVAWRPLGPNTVVRAGFGVFFDVHQQNRVGVSTPFEITEPTYTNPVSNPDVILPRVLPAGYSGKPATVTLPPAVDAGLQVPYSYQYNFTLEHQRWNTGFRASYIGTAQRQALYTLDINQPEPSTVLYVDKPRPFPRFPGINMIVNGAGHQYNSLTLEAERAYKGGLQWQASWAWSRDIGDVENAAGIEDSFNRARERGVMQDIPTHRVTGNAIYELPFGKGKKWGGNPATWNDLLIGGWSVSVIYQYSTGDFLTAAWTGPDPTGTRFTQSRTPAQVTLRPDQIRQPNLPPGERTLARYFDTGAFTAPRAGFFGTAARGTIIGPSAHVWNAGVFKVFPIAERARLRWEMVAQNVMNHPNWGFPITNITDARVGTVNSTGGPSATSYDNLGSQRTMRMGLRLEW